MGKLVGGGEVVGLTGELGSGKTCFVRGLAEGMGVGERAWVRSPSFTIINEYEGRLPLFHIDLYRVSNAAEMHELNLRDYIFSGGVCVIEWFDHLPREEVEEFLRVDFFHAGRRERRLAWTAQGSAYERLVQQLAGRGSGGCRTGDRSWP